MTMNVQTAEAILADHGVALKDLNEREIRILVAVASIFDKRRSTEVKQLI